MHGRNNALLPEFDSALFRQCVIPTVRYSDSAFFRQCVIPTVTSCNKKCFIWPKCGAKRDFGPKFCRSPIKFGHDGGMKYNTSYSREIYFENEKVR